MIDNLSILLSHGWLILAFWLLLQRTDLNDEPPPEPDPEPQGFVKRIKSGQAVKTKSTANPYRRSRSGKLSGNKDSSDA